MKNIFLTLGLLASFNSFASDCSQDAKDIAKVNLDQVAKKYGFDSSDVIDSAKLVKTVQVKISKTESETLSVFAVDGYIYKGSYTVTATLDSMCAVRNISIKDDSIN